MSIDNIKIACPQCKWEPEKHSKWQCTCGKIWNTFDTGGQCPQCAKQWKDTQCPSCHQWSPHIDWYDIHIDSEVKKSESVTRKNEKFQ